jgi:putative ABC transport system permease protein
VLLERSALRLAGVRLGDSLSVRVGGEDRRVRLAGTVYAPGLAPAWMEHMLPLFVTRDSKLRPAEAETRQLRVALVHPDREGFVRETADRVQAALERSGFRVARVTFPPPRHPHAGQMDAFLLLLTTFGLLSAALAAILAAAVVNALLVEQVREVGILKALGATDGQVATLFLGQVLMLSVAGLALGLPVGLLAGRGYAAFSASILNADVSAAPLAWQSLAWAAIAGLAVPLLVAALPLRRTASIPVREAIADAPPLARQGVPPALRRLRGSVALFLRATAARPVRLAVTVVTLALGGATAMAAFNVTLAWRRAVNIDFDGRPYDLTLVLESPAPRADLQRLARAVPAVTGAEYWASAGGYALDRRGVADAPVTVVGPEPGSRMYRSTLTSGRDIGEDRPRGALLNPAAARLAGGLRIGDSLRVRIQGHVEAFRVEGTCRELNPVPVAYVPRATVLAATGRSGDSSRVVRYVLRGHDDATLRAAADSLELVAARMGLPGVSRIQRMSESRQGLLDHVLIIFSVLLLAGTVVIFVGCLGWTSLLAVNVVQRTREIGVMAALGATPRTIAGCVWLEAQAVGGLGAVLAWLLAFPVSLALETASGNIFFQAPLPFTVSPLAWLAWCAATVVLGSLCCIVPARRASGLRVREALAHV